MLVFVRSLLRLLITEYGASDNYVAAADNLTVPFMFFKQQAPEVSDDEISISSTGHLDREGCDVSGMHTVKYGEQGAAVAHCSWRYILGNSVEFFGTKGVLRLDSTWGPQNIVVSGPAMHPGEPERANVTHHVPFEEPSPLADGLWSGKGNSTSWRSGMAHEIREVGICRPLTAAESNTH